MKLLLLSLLALACFSPYSTQASEADSIRIISYNILNGFNGARETQRMEKLAAWLQEKDPEVVALQELCGFTPEKLAAFAALYGHPYSSLQKTKGYPVGITSKQPITEIHKQTEAMVHGFLHVESYGLQLINVHLTPTHCPKRMAELTLLLDYTKANKLQKTLLMGDLNSVSPFDAEETEQHLAFLQDCRDYHSKYKRESLTIDDRLDYAVQAQLIAMRWHDVIRHYVPAPQRMTFPSKVHKSGTTNYLAQEGVRLDYIYASPDLLPRCTKAYVWNQADSAPLSDHFPVGVDIQRAPKMDINDYHERVSQIDSNRLTLEDVDFLHQADAEGWGASVFGDDFYHLLTPCTLYMNESWQEIPRDQVDRSKGHYLIKAELSINFYPKVCERGFVIIQNLYHFNIQEQAYGDLQYSEPYVY